MKPLGYNFQIFKFTNFQIDFCFSNFQIVERDEQGIGLHKRFVPRVAG